MANIHDVARLAGVSATTAKRAIRNPDKLAPATLQRVRHAIDTLHYEPDQVASALRSGHSNTIGLVVGSIVEPFFAELMRTIVQEVRALGYGTLVADNEYHSDVERVQLRTLNGNRVAGLILRSAFGSGNGTYLQRMQRRGIAIVEVDYFQPGSPFSHVMLDNRSAVFDGVAHLVAHGHTRIAALASYHPTINTDERVSAFPEAIEAHGLEVHEAYAQPAAPTEQQGYERTRALMRLATPPTALFATTGSMATGSYRALRDMDVRVPEDVSLLAFDDYPWMSLVRPGIDTFAQPVANIGREAVRVVLEEIERGGEGTRQHLRLPAELRVRGSVAAPPRQRP